MRENKPECEGCQAYILADTVFCGLPSIKDGVECPCIKCLVKTMCSTNQCEDFKNYLCVIWGPL